VDPSLFPSRLPPRLTLEERGLCKRSSPLIMRRRRASPGSGSSDFRKCGDWCWGKFLSDAAWYFYLFWLPKYLYDARGFDIKRVGYFAWIPYAASGLGSFTGGWFSKLAHPAWA